MGVFRAQGVVASVGLEEVRIGCCEGMVKGELYGRRGHLVIKVGESAHIERGWVAIGVDDGLPVACVAMEKVVCVLPVMKELGFRSDKGRRGEQEDDVVLLL